MTLQTKIEQALALAEAASPGPWSYRGNPMRDDGWFAYGPGDITKGCLSYAQIPEADAAFIAASRSLVPALAKALGVAERFIASRRCKTYVGIVTPGREVTCHAHDCPKCKALADIEKLMEVNNEQV